MTRDWHWGPSWVNPKPANRIQVIAPIKCVKRFRRMEMAEPIEANDDTWQQIVLDSETPVMVDFWAEWCGPCKMIAPAVHDMAVDYDGQLTVVKLDVDASPNTAMQYGIRSIPALLFFKDGQPVDQIVGAVPKGALKKKVDSVLGS